MRITIKHTPLEEKREECGVVAIYSKSGKDVAPYIYRALVALQHRGQDAAGFAIWNGLEIEVRRGIGLVGQIFRKEDLKTEGKLGIGHTRYPTIGECRMCDVQPTLVGNVATAHNGHIANYKQLKEEIGKKNYVFGSTNDSEVLAYLIGAKKTINESVSHIMDVVEGAYCDVAIREGKLIVFRDPFAIRPLVYGENEEFVCFCSETAALDVNNIPYKGEVRGGELIVLDQNGKITKTQIVEKEPRHCMFEYVYFAKPDSIINGLSVYEVRKRLGENLAKEAPVEADVVVAVPDSARIAANQYAMTLATPFEEGLMKDRYIGRTFIMPSQEKRTEAVRLKLNPVKKVVDGKRVVLLDDSIVRGTTLKEIVWMIRKSGAKEVHLRITCPKIIAPCFYGVDMSTYKELIGSSKTEDEIRKFLGADSLAYLSIKGLKDAIGSPSCTACLDGKYHTKFVIENAMRIKQMEQLKG